MTQQDGRPDEPGDKVRGELSKASDSVKSEAAEVGAKARDVATSEAKAQYRRGKEVADEQLGTLSSAVDDAASRLAREGHPLASYAGELSTQLGRLSGTIESSSLDDVAKSTHRLARENPGLFMLGSVALGFAVARFIKASDERDYRSNAERMSAGGNRDYQKSMYSPGYDNGLDDDRIGEAGSAPVSTVSPSTAGESSTRQSDRGEMV